MMKDLRAEEAAQRLWAGSREGTSPRAPRDDRADRAPSDSQFAIQNPK
jgi:hypothetical protein